MRRNIIPYNPRLKEYAKKLRRNMTLAEVLLWKRIKARQLKGVDFDRQRPIGEFIVDFYAKDLRLAIEVDGCSHDYKIESDAQRQDILEKLGVRFLRFWDHDVKNDMGEVIRAIEEWVDNHGEPTPGPSEEGNVREEVPSLEGNCCGEGSSSEGIVCKKGPSVEGNVREEVPSLEGCPQGGVGEYRSEGRQ